VKCVQYAFLNFILFYIFFFLFLFMCCSRNQLSVLPVSLCLLPCLQVLLLSNNKLVSLPEEIHHLRQLMELVADF